MPGFEASIETVIEQPAPTGSRLRERLRSRHGATPAANKREIERCEIICKWISGNINPRYQFRAVIPGRSTRTVIVARSPVFQSETVPVSPSSEARSALQELIDTLRGAGWAPLSGRDGKHWYSAAFERRTAGDIVQSEVAAS